jgi:flagellar biogenesis protein FliO
MSRSRSPHRARASRLAGLLAGMIGWGGGVALWGQTTNLPALDAPLPGAGASVLRLLGALILVIALFLGGVWAFQRWQRLSLTQGRPPKMRVLEARGLGQRHTLYVVGYEQQRLLLAASPTGVTLITHLPPAVGDEVETPRPNFTEALRQVLARKS